MCDGGDAAEEIFHTAQQQALVQGNGERGFERRIVLPAMPDLRNPFAGIAPGTVPLQRRQGVELQVIVRVDETRE